MEESNFCDKMILFLDINQFYGLCMAYSFVRLKQHSFLQKLECFDALDEKNGLLNSENIKG